MESERPPAVRLMRKFDLEPEPWQVEVLESSHCQMLLNCCRQGGKSTVVAVLALAEAIFLPRRQILILSRSHRQSTELFRLVIQYYEKLGRPLPRRQTRGELELDHGSRIVSLPCNEHTIRGYSGIGLMIIDEAAQVPDELYKTVRPMLIASGGRLICMSTPYGKRGFFYDCWAKGGDDWHRIEIPASKVPWIPKERLERDRHHMSESWFQQEYCCSFESMEGVVYPDFARCVVPSLPAHLAGEGPGVKGKPAKGLTRCGGLDFGFRNPFAALWGTLDRDGILWLTGEHYYREQSTQFHIAHLPKDVMWYADPSGARDIRDLTLADFKVRKGDNAIRPGIAAVRARLEQGTLRVLAGACPNLLAEAGLYRYETESRDSKSEIPENDNNHALDALRYLISKLDARLMARLRNRSPQEDAAPAPPPDAPPPQAPAPPKPRDKWLRYSNEELWRRIF